MTKRSIELHCATDPVWVNSILENFDAFLQDHANCERKASALAMSMVVKHPDREAIVPTLISIAREELEHFEQVHDVMRTRGLRLVKDEPDPYVNALLKFMRHGRNDSFLDRLLIFSLVECRGAERFGILSRALTDPQLERFYKQLWGAEAKHGNQFVEMALEYYTSDVVYARLETLAAQEAQIIQTLPWRASLH
ncbi:MAG: tRNA-(ms[2]io[6]A)-hydroxylase [Gammaproteobacteria bacterium]